MSQSTDRKIGIAPVIVICGPGNYLHIREIFDRNENFGLSKSVIKIIL
jgi:hypothetical protein